MTSKIFELGPNSLQCGNYAIFGDHTSTRLVEQIQSFFSKVLINPSEIQIHDLIAESRGRIPFKPSDQPLLLIFDDRSHFIHDQKNLTRRQLLMNGKHWRISSLYLFKNGLHSLEYVEYVQLDHRFNFPVFFSHTDPSFSYEEHCLWMLYANGLEEKRILRPWQKRWTIDTHFEYPKSVQQRVIFLLLAQRDPASPLFHLNKFCLMLLLEAGAALDK